MLLRWYSQLYIIFDLPKSERLARRVNFMVIYIYINTSFEPELIWYGGHDNNNNDDGWWPSIIKGCQIF